MNGPLYRIYGSCPVAAGRAGAAAVADLAADAVGTAPGQGLLAGLAGAAGNPLFVTEMLAALAQEGMLETAGGRAEVAQTALPPTLRLTILRRLSFLSDDMLQALRFASIPGASFTVTDLSVTMDRPVVELFGVLAEGITGRVLEDDGDRLRFRHDVIRDAIYEDMPATIRHGLHREAGQRLAQPGRRPCRWPSTWPAGPPAATPKPSAGSPGPPGRPRRNPGRGRGAAGAGGRVTARKIRAATGCWPNRPAA